MDTDRVERRKKALVIFLAFIMVSSSVAFIFIGYGGGQSSTVKYNDYTFRQRNSQWSTFVEKREALFDYLPADVLDIEADSYAFTLLRSKLQIDSTLDENATLTQEAALAQYQLGEMLNFHNIYVRQGLTEPNEFSLPVITCENANSFVPVLYFKEGNRTRIYTDGNCVIAEASQSFDMTRLKDRLLYGILGII